MASKNPVQIVLKARDTKLKVGQSLWYKLELKNVGKEKFRVEDRNFQDPWAVHENSRLKHGLYLEILGPNGKRLLIRTAGDRPRHAWEAREGEDYRFSPEESLELKALTKEWDTRGMTAQQKAIAQAAWLDGLIDKKNLAEDKDPAHQIWLAPGRSTTTFAWADRGTGDYTGRAEDDRALGEGYTQLWSYSFLRPGKYRVRAVYDHARPESNEDFKRKYGTGLAPAWVKVKTPFLEFEVVK
jgi:hypothetical protein